MKPQLVLRLGICPQGDKAVDLIIGEKHARYFTYFYILENMLGLSISNSILTMYEAMDPRVKFRAHSHSSDIQVTLGWHSRYIQGTFTRHSADIHDTFRGHSKTSLGIFLIFMRHSWHIQDTFRTHSGHIQWHVTISKASRSSDFCKIPTHPFDQCH